MSNKPLILVSNDDGIDAPGIRLLIDIAKEFGDILVVAPDRPRSGSGHAISSYQPLRLQKTTDNPGHKEYSCNGTPVDCIKLATDLIIKGKPDLLLSGINHGSNSSISVIYSGTMGAALEGAILDIPSIGFSTINHSIDFNMEPCRKYVKTIIKATLENKLQHRTCLNVNIPSIPESEIKGIKVCRQAIGYWKEDFLINKDPQGNEYYWLTGKLNNCDIESKDTDEWALKNNYVSIVPVLSDFTAHNAISSINKWEI